MYEKICRLNPFILGVIGFISLIGFLMLYSAGSGSTEPWLFRQIPKFILGMILLVLIAVSDPKFWFRNAYILYVISLVFLFAVEVMGYVGMGAQRWIDLYVFRLQPSEIVKLTLILALARYFHTRTYDQIGSMRTLLLPTLMILGPTALVIRQPDLGTAMLLAASGFSIFFVAGLRWWKILALVICIGVSLPIAWATLHTYQKERVLTFMNPERDPLGSGYHIMQSKIAFGAGGLWGKGYLQGSQSHLDFLPEKQTDFIFTMFCEEFGFVGGVGLLLLYMVIIAFGYSVTLGARAPFIKYLAFGTTTTLFLYVFINVAMVMGLVPVVGIPLPLVSYGGTALLTLLMGMGFLINGDINRIDRVN
jgi:rod shape determining protein RodA